MNKLILVAVFIIFLVIGLLLGAINLEPVNFSLYWLSLSMPLALFTSIVLFLGILISWIGLSFRLFRLKRENSRLQKSLQKAAAKDIEQAE